GTITPSSGWNSVNISNCPTLSASTTYWIGYLTGSNAISQGTVSGVCPGSSYHSTWANAQLSGASLANPFPANTQGSTCYSLYMTLNPVTGASQSAGTGQAIGVNATSLSFGGVALSQPATQALTLTNSGTSAGSVSAVTVTGAGFSLVGSTFPITLNAGQADTLNIQFDPTAAGAASGTLTILSSSTSNPVAQVSLSGTGVASQVDLKWNAPASSSAPVAGYNIYRSSATSSFERLNSSVDKQTTYQDGSLQVGGTYEYYVTTVNSAGTESSPSNTTTVSVP
ncbi:MAG: choice-of-anchor D domain-containing protein, partial [Terracidiphilus sp.]